MIKAMKTLQPSKAQKRTEGRLWELTRSTESELWTLLESGAQGLSGEKAKARLEEYGENTITATKRKPWYSLLITSILNPFSIVLLLIAAVSLFTDVLLVPAGQRSYATVGIILLLVAISGVLQYVQEAKSDKAAESLKDMVSNTATVLRDSVPVEIPIEEIVPGDVVTLSAGDMLPADVRVLSSKDLFINQASLTGESMPVEKVGVCAETAGDIAEQPNLCLMGSHVVSGSGLAVVLHTGDSTYLGSMSKALSAVAPQSSFERGVADVSRLLLTLMAILVPVIFLVNGFLKHDWMSALLFALSVAVGLTPELLPMIMTSTLARGAVSMSKHKTIVKNLSAIQTFGAMDVLCTDKTGTLTEDHIVLERYLDVHGNDSMRILRHAFLNSHFQTGLKNLMDIAIIERAKKEGLADVLEQYRKVDEIPFDFSRRRMSVVLESRGDKRQLITKGAVEEVLAICGWMDEGGEVVPFTESVRAQVLAITEQLNRQGLRVLALAQKNHVSGVQSFGVDDESDMVLLGYVAFLDPPKESSAAAIAALKGHGVRTVVLTGDNDQVAIGVCRQVGMTVERAVLGSELDALSDEALTELTGSVNLFAKLAPLQKVRVIEAFQRGGHIVGYMGDGINDAPAMKQADVGISVDSAVDIAKETANIILLEKSLMVLEEGVMEGRRTFANIVKYIKMAVSGNFGNMISVLIASVWLPFLPMLPVQILAQNLLYDFSQIAIPSDAVDPEDIRLPRQWDAKNLLRFMLAVGPISSLFDVGMYAMMWFVLRWQSLPFAGDFQTGWFVMGLLTQTLVVHWIRTAKRPFLDSVASKPLLISTALVSIAAIALPYMHTGALLGLEALPWGYYPWLLGVLGLYAVALQAVKKPYMRKFGAWI